MDNNTKSKSAALNTAYPLIGRYGPLKKKTKETLNKNGIRPIFTHVTPIWSKIATSHLQTAEISKYNPKNYHQLSKKTQNKRIPQCPL